MKKMITMRGCPGAGKTTKAKELIKEHRQENYGKVSYTCSADKFFINPENGKYEFDVNMLSQAHAWCRGNANAACELEVDLIIIDNTNMTKREYQPYEEMAKRFGYVFETCVVGSFDEQSLEEYANRNIHGVTLDAIRRMARRFQ